MTKTFFICIVMLTIAVFFMGYGISFYCSTINVDYSANSKETYENVRVVYSPEYNEITIYTKDGNKIVYGGMNWCCFLIIKNYFQST